MDGQERIVRKIFTEQHCHHCGHPYQPEQMLVLARRSEVWMVMISCLDCQQKDTFVVKFPPQIHGRRRVTSYRLSKPTPSTLPLPETLPEEPPPPDSAMPVNADDVLDMHFFLENFNGDFQQLFTEVD